MKYLGVVIVTNKYKDALCRFSYVLQSAVPVRNSRIGAAASRLCPERGLSLL